MKITEKKELTMNRTILGALFGIVMISSALLGQSTVSGTVTDADGNALPGANVVVQGTALGAAATLSGAYSVSVPNGTYTVTASVVGYTSESATVKVSDSNASASFSLASSSVALGGVEVLADRVDNTSAIPYDDYTKADIDFRLGGRGLPKALATLPNVYVENGGGWDDENVYVRGFDDRYTSYLINGIPMNDMENGNLYFSNWSVLADVASVVQVQRGAGSVNLATPSLGGVVNFMSMPASSEASVVVKQEAGQHAYSKTAVTINTGLMMDGKLAMVASASKRTADRLFAVGTYTEAWSYYFNTSYSFNENNRLEFVALGSPQIHGQSFWNNRVSNYSHELARDMGVAEEDLRTEYGMDFNPRADYLDTPFTGQKATASWLPFDGWNNRSADMYSSTLINERENYFHKPIVQLNSYNKLNDTMTLASSLYYSGGEGGGSGSAGSIMWGSDGHRDYDGTIARNQTDNYQDGYGYQSAGILRGSRNNQSTVGIVSKLDMEVSDTVSMTFGVDIRTATVEHYREVYNLLGGDFYYNTSNPNWTEDQKRRTLGDKVFYDYTNTVDWMGGYAQVNYDDGMGTNGFAMFGTTTASYTNQDHFTLDNNKIEADGEMGYQMKVGGSRALNDTWQLFGNMSYSAMTPSLDKVINDYNNTLNGSFENEKATWLDVGARFKSANGQWAGSMNYYYALWSDRNQSGTSESLDGTESFFSITGLNELHTGLEYSIAYQPIPVLRIDIRGHESDWRFTDNLSYSYNEIEGDAGSEETLALYVKDVMVSGAPQSQNVVIVTGFFNRLKVSGEVQSFSKQYPRWGYDGNIEDLAFLLGEDNTFAEDAYVTGNTTLVNFVSSYTTELMGKDVTLSASVFNAMDELYVGDFVDAYDGSGDVSNLRVRVGQPRSYNIGVTINY
jgi:iron complex outermembrane receptor protein